MAHVGLDGKHGSKANHARAAIQHLCVWVEWAKRLALGVEEGGDKRRRDQDSEQGNDAGGLLGSLPEDALAWSAVKQGVKGSDLTKIWLHP